MRAIILFSLIVNASIADVAGQLRYDWEERAENFHYRVKNIEFFIDRFNNQPEGSGSHHAANPTDTAACLAFMKERDSKMFSLFDLGRLDKKDVNTRKKINTFFRDINSPYAPRFLRFDEGNWFAEVSFKADAKGSQQKITCVLQVATLGQGVLGWVIRSFHAGAEPAEHFKSNNLVFPPSVNGTDFMNVRLSLNDRAWLREHATQDAGVSKILQQLLAGDLKIEHATKITYHFLQLEGWIMTVNYVDREAKNSGWLLDNVQPATPAQKASYLKQLYVD